MNSRFFINNREKVMENIEDNSMVILFAGKAPKKSADESYMFTPNKNFLYVTGIEEENVCCVLTKIKGELKEYLYILRPDEIMEKWVGKTISVKKAKKVSGVTNVLFIEDFKTNIHNILSKTNAFKVYLDLERDSWDSAFTETQIFARSICEKYYHVDIRNIYPMISEFRMIKQEEEIIAIKEAIKLTKEGFLNLIKNAKPGMKEYQMEAYYDFSLKSAGVKDLAFKSIVAGGKNATVLHYVQNDCEVYDGELVLLDLGAKWDNYSGDLSRTFPVNGKFTERQKQLYNIVLKVQKETISIIKPGVPFKELNLNARKVFLEELKSIEMAETDEDLSKYYYHGVSHYLGLDTHDVGSRDGFLKPGMVLTVEPGIYVEEEGIGIRIEDNVVVTAEGCEVLSSDVPKTVEEIESLMA